MFKGNNKDTKTTPLASYFIFHILYRTYFTPCSSVSIVNFEHVIANWVEEKFVLSLSAFLLLFDGKKRIAFKSSIELYFHPLIIQFF